jgi:four helix bundle protein
MRDFRDLKVWEKAHQIVLEVYGITCEFPKEELYGLVSQMRRSASSIPTNIAEGCGRGSEADFARFLQIAMGSACEIEYQLLLSRDLHFIDKNTYEQLDLKITEVKRMLTALIQKIRS